MRRTTTAQASLEYMIILSIALSVLSAIAYLVIFSSVDQANTVLDTKITNQPGRLAATRFQIDPVGTYIELINNRPSMVTIQNINIGGKDILFSQLPLALGSGESILLRSYALFSTQVQTYVYDVTIDFTDNTGLLGSDTFRVAGNTVLVADDYLQLAPNEPLGKDLVLLLRADDATDSSGYNRHIASGGYSFDDAQAVVGRSLVIPLGQAGVTLVPSHSTLDATQAFSYALWFNAQWDISTQIVLFWRNGSYGLLAADDVVTFYLNNGSQEQPLMDVLSTNTGDWGFYVFTYNGTNSSHGLASFYRDGMLETTVQVNNSVPQNNDNALQLGNASNIIPFYADEIAIWQRTLTAQEIAALYRRGMQAMS